MEDSEIVVGCPPVEEPPKPKTPEEKLFDLVTGLLRLPIEQRLPGHPLVEISANGPRMYEQVIANIPQAAGLLTALRDIAKAVPQLGTRKSGDRILAEYSLQKARDVLAAAGPLLDALYAEQWALEQTCIEKEKTDQASVTQRATAGAERLVSESGQFDLAMLAHDIDEVRLHVHLMRAHQVAKTAIADITGCIDEVLGKGVSQQAARS